MKIGTPYYTITPESIARERERLFEKASHDEAQALYHAEQKGIVQRNAEIAKSLLEMGMPLDQIAQVTGLTPEELESL